MKKQLRFQKDYGYEVPTEVIRWQWSDTFNRASALVRFSDNTECWTYPQDANHSSIPKLRATPEEMKTFALEMLSDFIANDWRKPWPGMEFCKAFAGNSYLNIARENGATEAEIRAAMTTPRGGGRHII